MHFNSFEEYFTYKEKFGEVEELYLSGNRITDIPEKWVFGGKTLYLSGNHITAIPEKWVFGGKTLYLIYNQITDIPEKWVFGGKTLYLIYNQITAIPEKWVFGGETLNLSGNQILNIPSLWNTKGVIILNSNINVPTFYLEIYNYGNYKEYIIPNILARRIQRFWVAYAYNPDYIDKDGFFTRPMARKDMLDYYKMVK